MSDHAMTDARTQIAEKITEGLWLVLGGSQQPAELWQEISDVVWDALPLVLPAAGSNAVAVLREFQFSGDPDHACNKCPACGNDEAEGHAPGCRLARALQATPEDQDAKPGTPAPAQGVVDLVPGLRRAADRVQQDHAHAIEQFKATRSYSASEWWRGHKDALAMTCAWLRTEAGRLRQETAARTEEGGGSHRSSARRNVANPADRGADIAPADAASPTASAATTPPEDAHKQLEEACEYAESLACSLAARVGAASHWRPMSGDIMGLLTQIDNATTGLKDPIAATTPPPSARVQVTDEMVDESRRSYLAHNGSIRASTRAALEAAFALAAGTEGQS